MATPEAQSSPTKSWPSSDNPLLAIKRNPGPARRESRVTEATSASPEISKTPGSDARSLRRIGASRGRRYAQIFQQLRCDILKHRPCDYATVITSLLRLVNHH